MIRLIQRECAFHQKTNQKLTVRPNMIQAT